MMKTQFTTEEKYAKAYLELAQSVCCTGEVYPERFKKVMWQNRGTAAMFGPFSMPEDGLELKNPLIVAVGDSVTAGHFEPLITPEEMERRFKAGIVNPDEPGEVTDVLSSYVDRFRQKLVEKYEQTSVSVINSGIAGDTILGIERRLDRDVLRYQPDLVIVNASLNWREDCGSNEDYYTALKAVTSRIKNGTRADIILMTPNTALPTPFDHPHSTLDERVEIIRKVAKELSVCLADIYKVWNAYIDAGYPVEALLANGANHPSAVGHEGFALGLMQLFK